MSRIITVETARALDPGVAAAIVAAAQDKAVRASAAAAADTTDTVLAALQAAADQEVSDLTTGGHVVAHAVTAARAEVEAACMGRGDTSLRDPLFAAAEKNRENFCSRSTSVFNDKMFCPHYRYLRPFDSCRVRFRRRRVLGRQVRGGRERHHEVQGGRHAPTPQAIDAARTTEPSFARQRRAKRRQKASKAAKATKATSG